jgi:serine/threonine-protein kinase
MTDPQRSTVYPECVELGGGRYLELGRVVGKGSTATVYRVVLSSENRVKRPMALKLFNAVSSDEADLVTGLLLRTARRAACVDHPNILRVYECGVWRGQPYLISELVEGISLWSLQAAYAKKQRRMPLDLALFITSEIGEALAAARIARDHSGVQLNILHQSLSAREVLLSWRGEVKVTDFEANVSRAASSSVHSIRGVNGRAYTMAPEVAQGGVADARSDVFSFGIVLRELLIGPRFPSSLTNADAVRLAREGYVQPITFQPHLPNDVVSVMTRALEVEPEARYPNAGAMALDLRRAALSMGVGDGRYFLRSALEREWSQSIEEVTCERHFVAEPTPPDGDIEADSGAPGARGAAVHKLEKRRR